MSDFTRFSLLFAVLLSGNAAVRLLPTGRPVPLRQSLDRFPTRIGEWTGQNLEALSEREKRVLGADDYLLRVYEREHVHVALFIAYYRSQQSGDALHSPKNCLPGAGWEPIASEETQIPKADGGGSLTVNHYVVQKDGIQQDVLYWYQAAGRTFPSEYFGKVFLVWNAFVRNRTDGALVRLAVLRSSATPSADLAAAAEFAGKLDVFLAEYLPD